MAYVWGLIIFDEQPSALSSLGTSLVILGLVAVSLSRSPELKVRETGLDGPFPAFPAACEKTFNSKQAK